MIVLVKQLWQRRTAIERFLGKDRPIEQADAISKVGDVIWTAFITYKLERDRMAEELGLTRPKAREEEGYDQRVAKFNDWANEAGLEEINLTVPPVPMSALAGSSIGTVDLIQLREIGLIDGS